VGDTLAKTTFRNLKPGSRVNLERALPADGRLGGHIVMGHVNGTARILSWRPERGGAAGSEMAAWFLSLELQPSWMDRVAPEGSIAVDGVSLTVAGVTRGSPVTAAATASARLSIIPHTRKATTFALKKEGDLVNIELDILAAYARARTDAAPVNARGLTFEMLTGWGYS
jgi:riboflavin synthase